MRTMKMHLDTVDAAPGTPAADAAMAEVLNCVQHVCVIFMAGAMHKPLVIKKLLAAEGISSSWRALEHEPINLVEMMKGCVVRAARGGSVCIASLQACIVFTHPTTNLLYRMRWICPPAMWITSCVCGPSACTTSQTT